MERPDNHYCDRCYYSKLDTLAHCMDCEYSAKDGFSGWKPMSFNGISSNDLINKPKHYILMEGLEVRDVLAALVAKMRSPEDQKVPSSALFESDYVQMMQYLMRFMDKNGKQDLEKARWYLEKLIAAYD